MEFVEPDDEPQPHRCLLPPDDRVWRHPSEMGGPRPSPRRQMWVVGLVSALAASLLSSGLTLVAATLLGGGEPAGRLRSAVLTEERPADGDVVTIAEQARTSIVQLRVEKGRAGSGSGFVYRTDGHILTNAHVVDGSSGVIAVMSDGSERRARLIGSDAGSDTAVIKIDGGPYQAATLGTTANLRVGERAVAIGSPLGLAGGPSVTVGVVSALHRTVRTRTGGPPLADLIQTDAPIAPGSSGGALFDGSGRVIGMTTAMAITDSGNEGFGFAVPIDAARWAADQLIATGKVTNVWVGVECTDLDRDRAVEMSVGGGTMVERVRADSPAAAAGVVAKDVIVSVDGRPVPSLAMLLIVLRDYRPGDVVTLDVIREKRRQSIPVTVAERPAGS